MASAVFDVGRAGAVKLFVLLSSGHRSLPHARSVGQQPPPNEAGHDRKPGEHTSVFGRLEILVGVVVIVGSADVVDSGSELELVVGTGTGTNVVVSVCVWVSVWVGGDDGLVEAGVDVGICVIVGITVMTAVEVATQPS